MLLLNKNATGRKQVYAGAECFQKHTHPQNDRSKDHQKLKYGIYNVKNSLEELEDKIEEISPENRIQAEMEGKKKIYRTNPRDSKSKNQEFQKEQIK